MTHFLAPITMIALLALIGKHPAAGLALLVIIAAWPIIKFVVRFWLEGFFLAKGAKAAHLRRSRG